jgi:hypothetical protein
MKKRVFLIATGALGGLGAVFSITPPQFANNLGGGIDTGTTPAPTKSAAPTVSKTPGSAPAPIKPVPTVAPAQPTGGSVTVTGDGFEAYEARRGSSWGNVVVKVTFTNGAVSAVSATQSPSSRSGQAFSSLNPYVQGQKITIAQIKSKPADSLAFVSGVSYTSIAYWESLKSAITKAGL